MDFLSKKTLQCYFQFASVTPPLLFDNRIYRLLSLTFIRYCEKPLVYHRNIYQLVAAKENFTLPFKNPLLICVPIVNHLDKMFSSTECQALPFRSNFVLWNKLIWNRLLQTIFAQFNSGYWKRKGPVLFSLAKKIPLKQ